MTQPATYAAAVVQSLREERDETMRKLSVMTVQLEALRVEKERLEGTVGSLLSRAAHAEREVAELSARIERLDGDR